MTTMSIMMDHYPSRKRRLCLSTKVPPSDDKNSKGSQAYKMEGQLCEVKGIPHPKKKQRKMSPSLLLSSDESTFEIHWDNNSRTPSEASKTRKPSKRNSKNNISTLLKHVPRKRTSTFVNKEEQESLLTTWMVDNLASSTANGKSMQKPNTRRYISGKRNLSNKDEVINFNEKIKKFLDQVKSEAPVNTDSGIDKCSSSFTTISSNRRNESPTYFSNSETDSLLNFDISNDSILSDFDTMSLRKTPMRERRVIVKTPKLRKLTKSNNVLSIEKNSGKKQELPINIKILDNKNILSKIESKTLVRVEKTNLSKTISMSNMANLKTVKKILKETNAIDNPTRRQQGNAKSQVTKNLEIEFEDDDLDEILSTQPESFPQMKDSIIQNSLNSIKEQTRFNKIQSNVNSLPKHKFFEKAESSKGAMTIKPDAIIDNDRDVPKNNDEDKMFDDVLANIDIDFKFKSQETPVRLSSDQRKLKTKSHTSPLPLSSHKKRQTVSKKTVEENNTNTTKVQDFVSSKNRALYSKRKTGINVNREVDQLHSGDNNIAINTHEKATVGESQKSYVSPGIATTACRKPFIPPKKSITEISQSYSMIRKTAASNPTYRKPSLSATSELTGKLPTIDLSVIEGICSDAFVDVNLGNNITGFPETQDNVCCSTQKCTMLEIEEKRKYAQHRLRQRLRKKPNGI